MLLRLGESQRVYGAISHGGGGGGGSNPKVLIRIWQWYFGLLICVGCLTVKLSIQLKHMSIFFI
jgi:hypothetical protein